MHTQQMLTVATQSFYASLISTNDLPQPPRRRIAIKLQTPGRHLKL